MSYLWDVFNSQAISMPWPWILLVGALIGWLIGMLLDWLFWRRNERRMAAALTQERQKTESQAQKLETLHSQLKSADSGYRQQQRATEELMAQLTAANNATVAKEHELRLLRSRAMEQETAIGQTKERLTALQQEVEQLQTGHVRFQRESAEWERQQITQSRLLEESRDRIMAQEAALQEAALELDSLRLQLQAAAASEQNA
jgi:chromosome segregation ATPase